MAAGTTIKLKRKAGAFTTGQLQAGEVGVNTTDVRLEFSPDGSAVSTISSTPTVSTNSSTPYTETVTTGQKAVLHNATGASITHNLPTAVGNTAVLTIKKIDASANTVTVDGNSTETIDGGTTAVLRRQYESITLVSDGTNWVII